MFALQFPRRIDDLLLQFSELGGAVALLTTLLLLSTFVHFGAAVAGIFAILALALS